MIRNWEYHNLYMDFSSMFPGSDHPSDIDMFYLFADNTLLLAEIKSEYGYFPAGQKRLLKKIIDAHNGDGVGLYITHDKLVQNGDTTVDVSICPVQEIYIKGEAGWRRTKHKTKTIDVLSYYKQRAYSRMQEFFT